MTRKALLLIDIQNDFLPTGSLPVPKGDEVIAVGNALMQKKGFFDHIIATQDWHPAHHQSFAANHPGKKIGELIDLHGINQILWPVHCVQNTIGAQLAKGLHQEPIQKIIYKGTNPEVDSYSTFFDNHQRYATELHSYLTEKGVTEVYLMGLATDYCVKYSALDAVQLGYQTTIICDGCRGINLQPTDVEDTYRTLQEMGVRLIDSSSLLE